MQPKRETWLLIKAYIQAQAIELVGINPNDDLSEMYRREIVGQYRKGIDEEFHQGPDHDELATVLLRNRPKRWVVEMPREVHNKLIAKEEAIKTPEDQQKFNWEVRCLRDLGISFDHIEDLKPYEFDLQYQDQPAGWQQEAPTEPEPVKESAVLESSPDQGKRGRSEEIDLVPEGIVYVIRHIFSGMVKVGITSNWPRRAEELRIGQSTEIVQLVWSEDKLTHEQRVHSEFDPQRLPQSEWFHLTDNRLQEVLNSVRIAGSVITVREATERAK